MVRAGNVILKAYTSQNDNVQERGGKRGGSGGEGTGGDAGWMEYAKDITDTSSAIVAWLHSPYDATIGGCMFARVKHCFKADKCVETT
ncbi:hypothetical protein HZH68_002970 [Vespula germanica]|uniref:Uncharacterized protein n=1 Tax=Vespula germanica TaxID=30212 RepID=A0A834NNE8_VESGE|nr:hypothetical protein HZH68_002970 [Vespula germanica]